MAHQIQNFDVHMREDRTLEVTAEDDAGNPLDITGAKILWHAANDIDSAAFLSKRSTGFGSTGGGGSSEIDLVGSTVGRFDVHLKPSDFPRAGVFYHEGRLTDSSGNDTFIFSGHATVDPVLKST